MGELRTIVFKKDNVPIVTGNGCLPRGQLEAARVRLGTLCLPLALPDDEDTYLIDLRKMQKGKLPYGLIPRRMNGDSHHVTQRATLERFDYAWISRANQVVLASSLGEHRNTIPDMALRFADSRTLVGLLVLYDPNRQYDGELSWSPGGDVGYITVFTKIHGGTWRATAGIEGRTRALAPVYQRV